MATNTKNYNFKKPDESDFYDIQDQNGNWDIADEKMEELSAPTFEDYSGTTSVPEASTAIEAIKSKKKIPEILANIKAAFKGVCLLGHIVNNCVTDNAGLPLSAAQGKVLKDLYTQLYSEKGTAVYSSNLLDEHSSPVFVWWNEQTLNTPYKAGLTNSAEGFAFCFGNYNTYQSVLCFAKDDNKLFAWSKPYGSWVEYAKKNDLVNVKYLANEFNAYNDTIVLTSTATDGSKIQLTTDGTSLYLNKKLKGATDWTTVWKK